MKKTLFILLAMICMAASAAKEEYKHYEVTIKLYYTIYYYEEGTTYPLLHSFTQTGPSMPPIDVYAKNEREAQSMAENKCSTMCSSDKEYRGTTKYNGKTVDVYRYTDIKATKVEEVK